MHVNWNCLLLPKHSKYGLGTTVVLVLFWLHPDIKPSAVCVLSVESFTGVKKSHFSHCFSGNIASCFFIITSRSMMVTGRPLLVFMCQLITTFHLSSFLFITIYHLPAITILTRFFTAFVAHIINNSLDSHSAVHCVHDDIQIIIHNIIFQYICYIFLSLSLLFLLLVSGFFSSSSETR